MLGVQPDFDLVIVRTDTVDSSDRDITGVFVRVGKELACKQMFQKFGL